MGFFDKIKQGLVKTKTMVSDTLGAVISTFVTVDEDFLEELEESMILADMGSQVASEAVVALRKMAKENRIKTQEDLKVALAEILKGMIAENNGIDISTSPSIILLIGVNGVGKTTTAGKLASKYKAQGKKVLLAAADTFRAAAAEQLAIWADRAKVDFVRHEEGSDPASVVFDAIAAAKARKCDVIICDTAGRLHNKKNLLNELAKIYKIIDRELPEASKESLIVLDATTGQNALSQAKEFNEIAPLTGIVLTKLDGTAKGGIVIAISRELKIPVKLVGVGEAIDDLTEFNAEAFTTEVLPQ